MVADHDRHRHRLILRFIHLIVGPGMARIEQNAGLLRPLHLQAVKAQVALAGLGIFRDHQPRADERPAVANAGLMDRHLGDIDIVAEQNFLLHRPGFYQPSFAKLFRAPDEFGNHLIALGAERHRRQRHVPGRLTKATPAWIARQIFKKQTAVARLPKQRAHLRARVNWFSNARQQSGFFQLIDPTAHVLSHERFSTLG